MSPPLRSLRRQRERGQRRVTTVTASSAIGATALAAAFGLVLAGGHSAPSSAAPMSGPVEPAEARGPAVPPVLTVPDGSVPARPVEVAEIRRSSALVKAATGKPIRSTAAQPRATRDRDKLDAPAHKAHQPEQPASKTHKPASAAKRLSAPTAPPRETTEETAQASSGGS
jgi:hypothetical protein